MAHREGIREYLKDVQVYGTIGDFGSGNKPIGNYLKPNTGIFTTIDKLDHVGADIVADLEKPLDLRQKFDFIFCLEVLEHIWDSKQLIQNIYNHLYEGGYLYLSQPFFYAVHKEDDVHRYTYHGLRCLLEEANFKVEDIRPTGGTMDEAWGYVVRARKASDVTNS